MGTEPDNSSAESKFFAVSVVLIRTIALLVVFALFPISVVQLAFHLVDSLEIEKLKQKQRIRQEHVLTRIKEADDEPAMLSRAVRKVFDKINLIESENVQAKFVNRLINAFQPAFDLYVFDENGRLRKDLSFGKRPRRAVEICFETLLRINAGHEVDKGRLGLLSSVLNLPAGDPQLLKTTRTLKKLGTRAFEGYFEWDKKLGQYPGKLKGYILLLHPGAFKIDHALKNSIQQVNKRFTSLQVGYIDPLAAEKTAYPKEIAKLDNLISQILTATACYEQYFEHAGKLVSFIPRTSAGYILAYSKIPIFFPRFAKFLLHILSLLWLSAVSFYALRSDTSLNFKIPTKLMGLFLFAIGTPSIVLLVGGYYALKDHENVLIQNTETSIQNKLKMLDENLPLEIAKCERELRDVSRQIRLCKTSKERNEVFKKVKNVPGVDVAYIVDKEGHVVAVAKDLPASFEHSRRFTTMVAKELINRINKTFQISSSSLAIEATESVIENIVGPAGALNIDVLSRELGQFILLSLGNESSYMFCEAIFNLEGIADYLVYIIVNRSTFQREFLKKQIPQLIRQPKLAMTVSSIGEIPQAGKVIFHPDPDVRQVQQMAASVIQTRTPMRYVSEDTKSGRLWYATMGLNLSKFAIVATTSLEPLKKQIQFSWMLLLLLALLVFISALQIGGMLSEHFLKPILALSDGMHAIEARKFEHKIPVLSNDEFGSLSGLMNHVLEGMKDLEVAKIVQENLFPSEPLETGSYCVWGQSKAMADIGGDYFDYFLRNDGTLLGLVGDVSGHGVSAALIMGMAKCALTMEELSGRSPLESITSFNKFLLANIKKKKMMTMFLYTLYPEENRLEFVNAGHNYPFWWHAALRTVTRIGSVSFPLGVRAKAVYKCDSIMLEPNDAILFFTDGLIEALFGPSNEMIGDDRAAEWFAEFAEQDPKDAVTSLFKRFDEFTQHRPASDDISLIILKRRAS